MFCLTFSLFTNYVDQVMIPYRQRTFRLAKNDIYTRFFCQNVVYKKISTSEQEKQESYNYKTDESNLDAYTMKCTESVQTIGTVIIHISWVIFVQGIVGSSPRIDP